jgi:hypothetical protein
LAAIFVGLEFAGLPHLMRFAGKVQAMPHSILAALRLSIAAEWDQLAAVYTKHAAHSTAANKAPMRK